MVAFNDVIALGAIARGAAHSAARTRAAWPAPSPALDPDKARFGSQSAAMTARSDQTKPSAQTVMTLTAVASGRAKTEISGGVTLARMPELVTTGADYVSIGALTHSAPAVDLSFELEPL